MVVYVDIQPCVLISSEHSIDFTQSEGSLTHLLDTSDTNSDYVLIQLPAITIASSHIRNNALHFERQFPFELPALQWSREKNGFPWNFGLDSFSIRIRLRTVDFHLVPPVSTQITLGISSKSADSSATAATAEHIASKCDNSIAIHIDTPPIEINLSQDQLHFVYTTLMPLTEMFAVYGDAKTSQLPIDPFEVSERPASPNNHSELKDFFGTIHTISENSSEDTLQEYGKFLLYSNCGALNKSRRFQMKNHRNLPSGSSGHWQN